MPMPSIVSSKDVYKVGQVIRLGSGRVSVVLAKKRLVDGWAYWTREASLLEAVAVPAGASRWERLRSWWEDHKEKISLLLMAARFIYTAVHPPKPTSQPPRS